MATTTATAHRHLHGLDHLRAFAITFVFLYHYGGMFPHPDWVNRISKFGWTGVDLFFVLSGYLIASQLFATIGRGQAISFREFFIKRFFRIIPAYLLTVIVYFSLPSFREREALAPLWKYLTFTQNLGLDLRTQGTFSHAWSLCIEEQFYLLLPLVLIGLVYFNLLRKGIWLLVFLFMAGIGIRMLCWHYGVKPFTDQDDGWAYWYKWLYYPTFSRLDGLLMGVSIAALFQFKPTLRARLQPYGNYLITAGGAVLVAAYVVCADPKTYLASIVGFPMVDAGYGLLVAGAVCSSSFLYKRGFTLTWQVASLSYVLYLTHKIVLHITQGWLAQKGWNLKSTATFVISTLACLLVAFILHTVLEKPFLRLRNHVLRSWPALLPQQHV
ncbi:Peptidoglycan/LPS O-acetylase OafA/YrhL, contains acyltransferase and SGNH-hydrolase domains [Chitinophaga costaii]|uniref:Peptidoglycan/LPS O-acetylase OafA/YrhL, contains acyltransferase and SGNH-hydrolase domains n=1 Tax=Chitinophaga costaii TaxID=1335309 RepID=A0A1C4DI61_9BACT|nr:acyltransferase [Chitinophaga costaii]PUZ24644.1 acyltransferase [Chitinophaga costaii]SCC30998.1 Peptidoglycan/LPS O-acetylase OafA/YrhL, contains acyltransferase and SGNH-hydrolase domains [Chitinophaga costaii]